MDVLHVNKRGLDGPVLVQLLDELVRETLDANGLHVHYSHSRLSVGCSVR
jgi:hypothetical protein